MPLMASRGASATMTIAGVGDPLSPQTGPLVLRIKELEEQHLAFRNSLICAFNQLLDLKDISTGVHSTRLAEWAIRVARKLNIPEEHMYQVEVAALLHDIGKIGVPDVGFWQLQELSSTQRFYTPSSPLRSRKLTPYSLRPEPVRELRYRKGP